jgi:hypothetical protein
MNAGAKVAGNSVFLHCDSYPPTNFDLLANTVQKEISLVFQNEI